MIVKFPDPILLTPTQLFDFRTPPMDAKNLATELLAQMHAHKGVGLAANQIGVPYRVFAIRSSPENIVFFNPLVVFSSEEQTLMEEGCLSLPGGIFKIKRPKEIRVRFQTPSGGVTTQKFEGLTARIIQHEIDHLDGVAFYNRANRYHRDKGMRGAIK